MSDREISNKLTNDLLYSQKDTIRYILCGPAGTGKTTFIRSLVTTALNIQPKKNIVIICPTHQSICNLIGTDDQFRKLVKTYAAFFKCSFDLLDEDNILKCRIGCCQKPTHDLLVNTTIRCLRSSKKQIECDIDLLIIEEASMFNHQYYMLLQHMTGIKSILFVGDSNQIPPITDNCLDCLNCSFSIFQTNINTETFKEQKRHCSELHIKLQTFLRNISGLSNITNARLKSILKSVFAELSLDKVLPLKAPILTYHVNVAQQINYLLTNSRRVIQVGDLVVIDRGSIEEIPVGSVVLVTNISNEFCNCIKLERGFNFVIYEVVYDNETYEIHTINPSEHDEYVSHCRALRATKGVGDKFKINTIVKEHLTTFTLGYAMTAHKAQGLTYDTSYVAYEDILSCKDKNLVVQILYSVISRARNNVILVTIPDHFRTPQGPIIDVDFRT